MQRSSSFVDGVESAKPSTGKRQAPLVFRKNVDAKPDAKKARLDASEASPGKKGKIDPNAPKKPSTAYFMFAEAKRAVSHINPPLKKYTPFP